MDSKHSNGYNVKGMSGKSDLILISNIRSLAYWFPSTRSSHKISRGTRKKHC